MAAQPGDEVILKNGTYTGQLITKNANVTYRAENTHQAILQPSKPGQRVFKIKHSGVVLKDVVIDGLRMGPTLIVDAAVSNVLIENNIIKNSSRAGIGICGYKPCANITIRHNAITDTGWRGPGECIFVGSPSGGDPVRNVHIHGNVCTRYTSNSIDLKPNTQDAHVHHNIFQEQLYRSNPNKKAVESGMVVRGQNHDVHSNIFRNLEDAGRAVLEPSAYGGHALYDNVIYNVDKVRRVIKTREAGKGSIVTEVYGNTFCNLPVYDVWESRGPLKASNNPGIPGGAPMAACLAEENRIENEM